MCVWVYVVVVVSVDKKKTGEKNTQSFMKRLSPRWLNEMYTRRTPSSTLYININMYIFIIDAWEIESCVSLSIVLPLRSLFTRLVNTLKNRQRSFERKKTEFHVICVVPICWYFYHYYKRTPRKTKRKCQKKNIPNALPPARWLFRHFVFFSGSTFNMS